MKIVNIEKDILMSSERLEKFKNVTYANTKSQAKTELQYIFEKATGECQLEPPPSPFMVM